MSGRAYKLFTPEEDTQLQQLVEEHGYKWDEVASKLGTNRLPQSVMTRYSEVLSGKYHRGRFTEAEDRLLLDVVAKWRQEHGAKKIAWRHLAPIHWPRRSPYQLTRRLRHLRLPKGSQAWPGREAAEQLHDWVDKNGMQWSKAAALLSDNSSGMYYRNLYHATLDRGYRKKKWTAEEKQKLEVGLGKFGRRWQELSEYMGTRSPIQIMQYVTVRRGKLGDKAHQHSAWTEEECRLLATLVEKYNGDWEQIATHIPGRTSHACQVKWRFEQRKSSSS
ncbi:hypothetical protein RI367_003031 [Sorochytrium milnesiophthora]